MFNMFQGLGYLQSWSWRTLEDEFRLGGRLRGKEKLYYDTYGHLYEIQTGEHLILRSCFHLNERDFPKVKDDELIDIDFVDSNTKVKASELSDYLNLLMGVWGSFMDLQHCARGMGINFELPKCMGTDPAMYQVSPCQRFLAIPMSLTPFGNKFERGIKTGEEKP